MSRAKDNSLDYFPLDVDFFSEPRIRRLRGRFGSDGPMFLIYVYCRCYGCNGYYIEANDDFYEDAALDIGCSVDKIGLMINYLLDKSLLDSKLFNTVKVITSHGIQAQYQKSKKGCKRDVEIDNALWVLKKDETEGFIKVRGQENNSEKKADNSGKKADNSENYPQSKVNKSKVKESKENTLSASCETDSRADVQRAVDAWNSIGLNKVFKLSPNTTRSKMLKSRIREYGIDSVLKAFDNVKNSDFLMGKIGNGTFQATFDWVIKPNNFPKVLEGNYANRNKNQKQNTESTAKGEYDVLKMLGVKK